MKTFTLALFILISSNLIGQTSSPSEIKSRLIDLHDVWDTNYVSYPELKPILKDVEIVMLGEQTHHDGTTFATKVKLIKFLHQEMGFDILAFESGFYECAKAWQEIENGTRIDSTLAFSIFSLWSETNPFIPLVEYLGDQLKTEHPLRLAGFDSQFTGKTADTHFMREFKQYLSQGDTAYFKTDDWQHFENTISFLTRSNIKALKRNDSNRDTLYANSLIERIQDFPANNARSFWIRTMENVKIRIDGSSKSRDYQMAQNLIWLKEQNPGKKIICWGATSHFLYNSELVELSSKLMKKIVGDYYQETPSMGNYLKDKYDKKIYTIGFTAYEGRYFFSGSKKIDPAKSNSLEALLATAKYDNCFLPLGGLTISPLESRPLAYKYMTTDISKLMDGVIFNRTMLQPGLHFELIYELHPEYKRFQKHKKKKEKQDRKDQKRKISRERIK